MELELFHGCKVALICEDHLLVYKRDDDPRIDPPGMWDLPGGGRKGTESPEECVLRELKEEFGFSMSEDRLAYCRRYDTNRTPKYAYYFVGWILEEENQEISFGDEGQYWKMISVDDYLAHAKVVTRHKERLMDYFTSLEQTTQRDA